MTQDRTVRRDGVKLAYQLAGPEHGVPLALVMGLGQSGRMWDNLIPKLTQRGFRLLIPDNRGTGRSDTPSKPWSMADMGDDLVAMMDDAQLTQALVCGVSLGGMISQQAAVRHPSRVAGLVLCATTCGLPHGRLPSPDAIKLLLKLSFRPRQSSMQDMQRLLCHVDNGALLEDFLKRTQDVMLETPTTARGFFFQLLAALSHNVGARLPQVAAPTVVISGVEDALIPPVNSRIIAARIPGATLHEVNTCGHILPHEHPDRLIAAIEQVRDRLPAKQRAAISRPAPSPEAARPTR